MLNFIKKTESIKGGFLNYRQFTCHPEKGILVAPISSTYVFQNFENPTAIDNLSQSGSGHIFQVPGNKVEKYDRTCPEADIEIFNGEKIECLCNDGFDTVGSGSDLRCTKNEKWGSLQRHCPANKFQCKNDLCINFGMGSNLFSESVKKTDVRTIQNFT